MGVLTELQAVKTEGIDTSSAAAFSSSSANPPKAQYSPGGSFGPTPPPQNGGGAQFGAVGAHGPHPPPLTPLSGVSPNLPCSMAVRIRISSKQYSKLLLLSATPPQLSSKFVGRRVFSGI